MKIITVVGARPQFVKAAMGSRILRKNHKEIIVHTGQHYDTNMSDVFFEEMGIPKADYNLGISGGNHGEMTGNMMIELEKILLSQTPNAVLVYGDTNSTMAAALTAVKLHIPVIHCESGNRFNNLDSPEEVNRIVTDHVSKIKFACSGSAYDSLVAENIGEHSYLIGDLMYDAFLYYQKQTITHTFNDVVGLNGDRINIPDRYYYMTCHRQENTDDIEKLHQILLAMESLEYKTIYPVHPRNQKQVSILQQHYLYNNIIFIRPIGYLSSIKLISGSDKVVTDSGGVQREAFFAKKKCVTVLDFDVWPETMVGNRNDLAKPCMQDIIEKLHRKQTIDEQYKPFGNGDAARKMCSIINRWEQKIN